MAATTIASQSHPLKTYAYVDATHQKVLSIVGSNKLQLQSGKLSEFTGCYSEQQVQNFVKDVVEPAVVSTYNGTNNTVIVHGSASATAAAKPKGDVSLLHIGQSLCDPLFQHIDLQTKATATSNTQHQVTLSLYTVITTKDGDNSQVIDLLSPSTQHTVNLVDQPQGLHSLHHQLSNCSELLLTSTNQAVLLLHQSHAIYRELQRRHDYSNSHLFMDVRIHTEVSSQKSTSGLLRIVQLSSSTGIHRSVNGLQPLYTRIQQLSENVSSVYNGKQDKLLTLLEPTLAGNSVTSFIQTYDSDLTTPEYTALTQLNEQLRSLKTTVKPVKNIVNNTLHELRTEVRNLRSQLQLNESLHTSTHIDLNPHLLHTMKYLTTEIQRVKELTFDRRKQLSVDWQHKRQQAIEELHLQTTLTTGTQNANIKSEISPTLQSESKLYLKQILEKLSEIESTPNAADELYQQLYKLETSYRTTLSDILNVENQALYNSGVVGVEILKLQHQQQMLSHALPKMTKDQLYEQYITQQYRSQVQLQVYEQHMLTVFKQYRTHFEEQTIRMEHKYRELLQTSMVDALKLNDENQLLKKQLQKLKGRVI